MCGRYTLDIDGETLWEQLNLIGEPLPWQPRFNIAPTQEAPIVGRRPGVGNGAVMMRWGFSHPTELHGRPLINARSETAHEKRTFREAMSRHRCIVPVSGFYEWRKGQTPKQPVYATSPAGGLMGLAGLWTRERLDDPGDDGLRFVVLTRDASDAFADVHHRMPCILPRGAWGQWLDPGMLDGARAAELLRLPPLMITHYDVSRMVSNVRNDGPGCIEPADKGLFDE